MSSLRREVVLASIAVLLPKGVQGEWFVKEDKFEDGDCETPKELAFRPQDTCDYSYKMSFACDSDGNVTKSKFTEAGCAGTASSNETYVAGECQYIDGKGYKYSCVSYSSYAQYAVFENADCSGGYKVLPTIHPEGMCIKRAGKYYKYVKGTGIKQYSSETCDGDGDIMEQAIGSCFESLGYAQRYNVFPPEDEAALTGAGSSTTGSGAGTATLSPAAHAVASVVLLAVVSAWQLW